MLTLSLLGPFSLSIRFPSLLLLAEQFQLLNWQIVKEMKNKGKYMGDC